MTKTKSFHIYLNEKCLFKNLNEEEFHMIWSKLYTSYWDDDLTYTEITNEDDPLWAESSY